MNPGSVQNGPNLRERSELTELSDLNLLGLTRSGDEQAYAVLWNRHRGAGIRAARSITEKIDPEDMLQEAFARIFSALKGGSGPKEAFRPYLYSVLRSISMSWTPAGITTMPLESLYADSEPSYQFEGESLDKTITSRAFSKLKPEWRKVLWYVEVEGMAPREVAPLLGMTPNAVSALVVRAKEGLRVSWLQAHLKAEAADPACQWYADRLGSFNRGTLTTRANDRVEEHLASCTNCTILVEEVDHLSRNLGLVLLPIFLGPAAAASFLLPAGAAVSVQTLPRSVHARRLVRSRRGTISIVAAAVAAGGVIVAAIAMAPDMAGPVAMPGILSPPSQAPVAEERPSGPEAIVPSTREVIAEIATGPDTPPGLVVPPVGPEIPISLLVEPAPSPLPTPKPSPPTDPSPESEILAVPAITAIAEQDEGLFLPVVSGTGAPGAQVAIMADSKQVALVPVGTDGMWSAIPEVAPGPDGTVRLSAYQILGALQSAETPASAALMLKTPVIGLVTKEAASAQVTFSGIKGATVEAMLDGVPTGNYHTLTDTPLPRTLSNLTPGRHILALRYVDRATGRHGAPVTVIINIDAT